MDDLQLRLLELTSKGYTCSQILLILALELQGKEDFDLIRAMSGLARGSAAGEGTCGTLTGAACLLGLYGGKGCDDEMESERLPGMLEELWDWFEERCASKFGGITCREILADGAEQSVRCGPLVVETFRKALEILTGNGFDPTEGR
jgi:hypothetical protein